jgi:hypothetical protein
MGPEEEVTKITFDFCHKLGVSSDLKFLDPRASLWMSFPQQGRRDRGS